MATASPVDVLVLVGPFVDSEHPAVAGGTLDRTHEDVWRGEVAARVAAWRRSNPATSVVLMPSLRDATALPVFPQPPFAESGLAADSKVR